MKIKVLKSKKTDFPSYWTPVHIVVKGEEEKGAQKKGLNVYFSKSADKKLPVDFKGGILECKGEDVNVPFVYEIKFNEEKQADDYPFVYIKDFDSISPLPQPKNTCTFDIDEEETPETEIKNQEETPANENVQEESKAKKDKKPKFDDKPTPTDLNNVDLPDDDLPF